MIIGIFGACGPDVSTRFDEAAELATERFGDDDQLTVSISPGRVSTIAAEEAGFSIGVVASGPFPMVAIDNGSALPQPVSLALGNVHADWAFATTVTALDATVRRDPGCDTDQTSVLLADAEPSAASGTTVQLDVEVPACARLEISAQPRPDATTVRVVVIGAVRGDRRYLRAALNAASTLDAEYLQFLGDVGFSGDVVAFDEFESIAREAGLPFGVAIARQDRFAESDFVARFGGSDYTTSVGQMRFMSLDTASGVLSDAQLRRITTVELRRPPGIVVSSAAPLGFGTTEGLTSAAQGARVVEELASRGFLYSVSASGPHIDRASFGDLEFYDLSGAGTSGRSVALVEFGRPWPALDACTTSIDCTGEDRCNRGFCRTPCRRDDECATDFDRCDGTYCVRSCDEASDCPGPRPECVAGTCELDPFIDLTLSEF